MNYKSIALAASTLVLSTNLNAALVTVGNLSTYDDGSSNIIIDDLNNVEYLRLDVLADLTYAQTLAVLDTQDGGGWSIATSSQAVSFTNAMLSGGSTCTHDGDSIISPSCGYIPDFTDGLLGNDYTTFADVAWFLPDNFEPAFIYVNAGTITLNPTTLAISDDFAASGTQPDITISWLVVRGEVSAVPVPAAAWLFGSGLLGLIGAARRKVQA